MSYLEMFMLSYLKNERGNEDSLWLINQSLKAQKGADDQVASHQFSYLHFSKYS